MLRAGSGCHSTLGVAPQRLQHRSAFPRFDVAELIEDRFLAPGDDAERRPVGLLVAQVERE
jgi:hypothetical protein